MGRILSTLPPDEDVKQLTLNFVNKSTASFYKYSKIKDLDANVFKANVADDSIMSIIDDF